MAGGGGGISYQDCHLAKFAAMLSSFSFTDTLHAQRLTVMVIVRIWLENKADELLEVKIFCSNGRASLEMVPRSSS